LIGRIFKALNINSNIKNYLIRHTPAFQKVKADNIMMQSVGQLDNSVTANAALNIEIADYTGTARVAQSLQIVIASDVAATRSFCAS
jgi:hypothetical protein